MTLKINIGIVGGCAITQNNIPKENRFFSVSKKNIESDLTIETSLSFSNYANFYQLEESIMKLLAKKKTDLLIIQIRPQPFLNLTKLMIRGNDPKISFNHLIFNRNHSHKYENELPPKFNQLVSKPLFMEFNIFLGRLIQLNKIASNLIINILVRLHSICVKDKVQLLVLGISPQPMTKQGNINCRSLDNYLKKKCNSHGINYIDTFEKMNDLKYYEKDKVHLSELGHFKLGESLSEGIKNTLLLTFCKNSYNGRQVNEKLNIL